jgi:hypothetical protein
LKLRGLFKALGGEVPRSSACIAPVQDSRRHDGPGEARNRYRVSSLPDRQRLFYSSVTLGVSRLDPRRMPQGHTGHSEPRSLLVGPDLFGFSGAIAPLVFRSFGVSARGVGGCGSRGLFPHPACPARTAGQGMQPVSSLFRRFCPCRAILVANWLVLPARRPARLGWPAPGRISVACPAVVCLAGCGIALLRPFLALVLP